MWRRHRKKEPYDVRGTRNHASPFPDMRNTRGIRDSERGTRLTTAQRNEENRNRTRNGRERGAIRKKRSNGYNGNIDYDEDGDRDNGR